MRNVVYLTGIVLAVAVASRFAFDARRAGTIAGFALLAVPTTLLAIAGLARAKYDGTLKDWLSVRSGDITRGFTAAAVLFGGAYAFMKVVAPPESSRSGWLARFYLQLGDPTTLRQNVWVVIVALCVLAAAEEILWRGLVVSLLEEKIGSRRAWVWAAVLYAIAYVPTVWALRDPLVGPNPTLVLGALAAGLLWGGMARKFERLLPSIFSHVLFLWTVVMMFRLWGPSV